MSDMLQIQEELQQAAARFKEVVDKHGVRSFLFVMLPGTNQRMYDSNFSHNDPAFYYLNQAVSTDMILKQEIERWKHFVTGTRQTFSVDCINNVELERFLEVGKKYCVVSVLHAVDGYCFILSDSEGNWISPPPDQSGFHSSRFQPDLIQLGLN